jgi:predicted polyphosphate/ATP-dependent NAD kinase
MSSIGLIANPVSGKDIRRLVSHATVIDNNEKVNIIERIILGAQPFGVDKIYVMPDSYGRI